MSNETKQDVFNALMADMSHGSEQWRARYDAAFPDNLPVIPKAIGEYIQERKAAHDSLAFALTSPLTPNEVYEWICTVTGDSDTELSQIEYVKQQDTFARAWVLGVWRVEKTGEIVKLEEEK